MNKPTEYIKREDVYKTLKIVVDVAFAAALVLIIVLFGTGLLIVQRSRNMVFYSHEQNTAVPIPAWQQGRTEETSA